MGASTRDGSSFQPAIAGFFCEKCGENCLSSDGEPNGEYPESLKSVRLICAEKVEPDLIRQAFQHGADGVLICGCQIGNCGSMADNAAVLAHIHRSNTVLKEMGIETGRLRQEWVCAPGVESVPGIVADFADHLRKLGPRKTAPTEAHQGNA